VVTTSQEWRIRMTEIFLHWEKYRYSEFRDLWNKSNSPCVYCQTDKDEKPLRVGKAERGIYHRYFGSVDAISLAGYDSENFFFVAPVDLNFVYHVESQLIKEWDPPFNRNRPSPIIEVRLYNLGEPPKNART
jgi:hypothetical protein